MRRGFAIAAVLIALSVGGFWFVRGAHAGWTRTTVQIHSVDEVTGLDGVSYEKRFVPGIDFLGTGLVIAAAFGGAAFLFRAGSGISSPEHPRKTGS